MICPKCGKTIEDQSSFCYNCGASIKVKSSEIIPQTNDDSALKKSDATAYQYKRLTISPVTIMIIAVIVIVVGIYYYNNFKIFNRGCEALSKGDYATAIEQFDTNPTFKSQKKRELLLNKFLEELSSDKDCQEYHLLFKKFSVNGLVPYIEEFALAGKWKEAYKLYSIVVDETDSRDIGYNFAYNNLFNMLYCISHGYYGFLFDEIELTDIEISAFEDLDYYYNACVEADENSLLFGTNYDVFSKYDTTRICSVEDKLYNSNIILEKNFSNLYSNLNKLNGTWLYTGCVHKETKEEKMGLTANRCGTIEIYNGWYNCYDPDYNVCWHDGYLSIDKNYETNHFEIIHELESPFILEDIDQGIIYIEDSENIYKKFVKIS